MTRRVRGVNTAPDSENKIHDDRVAAQYGFRGGLVPGVTVYGYMATALMEFAPEWVSRGSMKIRFLEPVYDGETVVVTIQETGETIAVYAEREDGTVCASAVATMSSAPAPELIPEHPLPGREDRVVPSLETLILGAVLGSVVEKLETAEPRAVLQFSNEMLVRNFKLGPWIHVGSEIQNYSAAHDGDRISARGRIHDRYERKGHEFVVADVMLVANGDRLVHSVRHTAIYRPRPTRA